MTYDVAVVAGDGEGPGIHRFMQLKPEHTYCQREGCRKHYSEAIHHKRGWRCPNGFPCAVCGELPLCRHCGDPLTLRPEGDYWIHDFGDRQYYRCQKDGVAYGHNAAHPEVECEAGVVNACLCTR